VHGVLQICLLAHDGVGASDASGGRSASRGRWSAPQRVLRCGIAIVAVGGRSAAMAAGDGSRSVAQDKSGMSCDGGARAADFGVLGLSARCGMHRRRELCW
jgi:hypothetical protein